MFRLAFYLCGLPVTGVYLLLEEESLGFYWFCLVFSLFTTDKKIKAREDKVVRYLYFVYYICLG
jgi:hypothetical protein